MAYINLKDLKQNIGGQLKLKLNSSGVFQEKEWQGKKFNTFKYEVVQDNQVLELDATDSLKRKLDILEVGDTFLLSWEEFTTDEGQLRNYWKVDKIHQPKQEQQDYPVYETLKPEYSNGTNEFDERIKREKEEKDRLLKNQVQNTTKTYTNGARFGMLFNQTMNLFIETGMSWTSNEFLENFKRVEGYVELCEGKAEEKVEVKKEEKKTPQNLAEAVKITEDDLPF
tara:strand:- start:506 stop:1183 length:678 start_codon:yes stop_codon:yes gene_type:complete